MRFLPLCLLASTLTAAAQQTAAPAGPQSKWVHLGPDGHLVYAVTPQGDRIADFSYAGYMGGGVALPDAAVAATLGPSGGDDTAAIQAALDKLSAVEYKVAGPHTLVLSAGTFHLAGTLRLAASDLVLRGAGRGKTILALTGKPHLALHIDIPGAAATGSTDDDAPSAAEPGKHPAGAHTTLPEQYIPSGTRELPVLSAAGFGAGDTILLKRSIPDAYLKFMGMDHLVRDGKDERWVGSSITTERRIAAIHGNTLVLDVPLTDDYDPRFGGGAGTTVNDVPPPARVHQVGVESLTISAPAQTVDYAYNDQHFDAIQISAAEDIWLRDLDIRDEVNFVRVEAAARRITIDRVDLTETREVTSSAKPFGFSLAGTQTLVMRSSTRGNKIFFAATQSRIQGPNVVLACDFTGDQALEPHQRWSTGFLVDSTHVHGGGIHFINRGEMGSGHGWTIGWAVVWNSSADQLTVQQPPGSINWVIGSSGERTRQGMPIKGSRGHNGPDLPEGLYESYGKPVQPASLYLQQLADRLGPQAVHNIGW